MRRILIGEKRRDRILNEYSYICVYCGEDASELDHVTPYSWSQDNSESNLVPSCRLCNAIAYNKIFESFEKKKEYILEERKKKRFSTILSICTNCENIFTPRNSKGSTLFLCENCSNLDYEKQARKPRKNAKRRI